MPSMHPPYTRRSHHCFRKVFCFVFFLYHRTGVIRNSRAPKGTLSNHLIHITWSRTKTSLQTTNKQKCQIIHRKPSRILKAAQKQVAEVSRKSSCFFQTAQKFWLSDEGWSPITALKSPTGLFATFTTTRVGISVSSNTLLRRVPLHFFFWGCQKHSMQ